MKNTQKTVLLRRKRARMTNYGKRLKLLAGHTPRLVVRKSLHYISAQIVDYKEQGDVVVASAHSKELAGLGYKASPKNIPAAYLTGMLLAKKAKKANVKKAVLDSGLYPSILGSKIYAALKGAVDGGLAVPHDAKSLPSQDRISGKHVVGCAQALKGAHNQFTKHKPDNLSANLEEVKKKIMEMK